jgi:hypothetical protein
LIFFKKSKLFGFWRVSSGMNQEEHQDRTWDLLTRAKEVAPSPFFVRNVLREVRQLGESPRGLRTWIEALLTRRVALIGATACATLALFLVPLLNRATAPDGSAGTIALSDDQSDAFDPASEMAAIEYLGQLMAVADPGLLDDASLAELFF